MHCELSKLCWELWETSGQEGHYEKVPTEHLDCGQKVSQMYREN